METEQQSGGTVAGQVGAYMKTLDLSQPHYSRVFTDDTGKQTTAEMQQQYISGPSQPFPFVAHCGALQGKTAPEMFDLIGYEEQWLRDKLDRGQKFYLVFFGGGNNNDVCTVADWAGITSVVEETSPVCAKKLAPHIKTMREMAARDPKAWRALSSKFEALSPDAYKVVSSFDGYAASPIDTVGHARAFLRHTLKCTPLYQGDGYAYDEDGTRGVAEALVPRMRIADLPHPSTGVKSPLFCISDDL